MLKLFRFDKGVEQVNKHAYAQQQQCNHKKGEFNK